MPAPLMSSSVALQQRFLLAGTREDLPVELPVQSEAVPRGEERGGGPTVTPPPKFGLPLADVAEIAGHADGRQEVAVGVADAPPGGAHRSRSAGTSGCSPEPGRGLRRARVTVGAGRGVRAVSALLTVVVSWASRRTGAMHTTAKRPSQRFIEIPFAWGRDRGPIRRPRRIGFSLRQWIGTSSFQERVARGRTYFARVTTLFWAGSSRLLEPALRVGHQRAGQVAGEDHPPAVLAGRGVALGRERDPLAGPREDRREPLARRRRQVRDRRVQRVHPVVEQHHVGSAGKLTAGLGAFRHRPDHQPCSRCPRRG